MAYPTWITAAGNLGIVPSLEYYQFQLDAYDTAGGTLAYTKISGTLPPGIQLTSAGILQGIPVSTAGPDINQVYTFTVRVKNLADNLIADRTFNITITNVAPPIITPHSGFGGNIDLGTYYDGTVIDIQLEAIEFIQEDNLTWSLAAGTLPPGLRLSPSGLIYGYIIPIPVPGPAGDPGWDDTAWDGTFTTSTSTGILGWDFNEQNLSRYFNFTVEVSDGTTNSDTSTYQMLVVPRSAVDADANLITADSTILNSNVFSITGGSNSLTVDAGDKHDPIIISVPSEILPERQGAWFTFKIEAIDLDNDVLQYNIPALSVGSFDQQTPTGNPYLEAIVVGSNITIGTTSLTTRTLPNLVNGEAIQVLAPYTDVTTGETYFTWYNATVNAHTTIRVTGNTIVAGTVGTFITQTVGSANATITNISATTGTITLAGNLSYANVGDVIRQTTTVGEATVIGFNNSYDANVANPNQLRVQFTSGTFDTVGNITVNGISVAARPTEIVCNTDISAIYNTSNLFRLNSTDDAAKVNVSGVLFYAYPTTVVSVGVNVSASPSTQGNIGFDEDRFDQGSLSMPGTLSIDTDSGWITGFLPSQVAASTTYEFAVQVFKRDYPEYISDRLFVITILGSLNNTVNWLTPSYLGSIQNGSVSDLSITAFSTQNKQVYYVYTPGAFINLPQGLRLQPDGLISGRVSFELFSLDAGLTTFDSDFTGDPTTTFDQTFRFSVNAITFDGTASNTRVFSIYVRGRNIKPYENLYLEAALQPYQRLEFRDITQDQSVFPPELIYRATDPWFGISDSIRTLFLPGLSPTTMATYVNALQTNHFRKRLLFGNIKTAVARTDGVYDVLENATGEVIGTYNIYTTTFVPTDFSRGYTVLANAVPSGTTVGDQHIKYEVVYLDLLDENSNEQGQAPADVINLSGIINNPYYNDAGNAFVIANPNAFNNMRDAVINSITYANKGALPDWMTSTQPNGTILGYTRAVVLTYTEPGASETIAWRLAQRGYDLNELNFTVDRYQLDNNYSANYDIASNSFITSTETTFDRYPALLSTFKSVGTVDYAVSTAFEEINERAVSTIIASGGLDGVTSFRTGDRLVFFEQEFSSGQDIGDAYNQGWTNSTAPWDDPDVNDADWDANGTQGWDAADYVPGYNEWISSRITTGANVTYSVANQRISIWQIQIDAEGFLRLSLANATATLTSITANTTGYGSNVRVSTTANVFVGMKVIGTGFANTSTVTDVIGSNVVIWPAATGAAGGTITFIPTLNFNQVLYVRNGLTRGGTNIYYDPIIKANKLIPNFSKIPQQVRTTVTIFDGNGTRFFDFRDTYTVPEQGDTALIFPRINVFN
jgi:hypothetical protein